MNREAANFEAATDRLLERFRGGKSVAAEIEEVRRRETLINSQVPVHIYDAQVYREWRRLRSDLGRLARYYNLRWNWSVQGDAPPLTQRPYRIDGWRVERTLSRIETRSNEFQNHLAPRSIELG